MTAGNDAVTELLAIPRSVSPPTTEVPAAHPPVCSRTASRGWSREAAHLEASPFASGSLLSIQGRLDVGAARRLLDIAQGALSASPAALVVDLTAATSLDAFGRAALRRVIRRAGRRGTVVYLVANPSMQQELGDVTTATARSRVVSKRRIALAAAIAASAH